MTFKRIMALLLCGLMLLSAVACGKGAIRILQVTPEGKGKMSAGDFVRGRKIAVGNILGK